MNRTMILLLAGMIAFSLPACSSSSGNNTGTEQKTDSTDVSQKDASELAEEKVDSPIEETTDAEIAEYEGRQIEILDAEFTDEYKDIEDGEGIPAIMVRFHFINTNSEPIYALSSFGISAYQDGIELEYLSLNDSVHEEAHNIITAVKDGAEIDCMMAFATKSDGPVEVRITTPTADANLLLKKAFEK